MEYKTKDKEALMTKKNWEVSSVMEILTGSSECTGTVYLHTVLAQGLWLPDYTQLLFLF